MQSLRNTCSRLHYLCHIKTTRYTSHIEIKNRRFSKDIAEQVLRLKKYIGIPAVGPPRQSIRGRLARHEAITVQKCCQRHRPRAR